MSIWLLGKVSESSSIPTADIYVLLLVSIDLIYVPFTFHPLVIIDMIRMSFRGSIQSFTNNSPFFYICSQELHQMNVMNLEMQDYQRTVESYQTKVADKESKIQNMSNHVQTLEETISTLNGRIGECHLNFEALLLRKRRFETFLWLYNGLTLNTIVLLYIKNLYCWVSQKLSTIC